MKVIDMEKLTKEEKYSLMINIMYDLRGDWGCDWESRAEKVRELAIELDYPRTAALVDCYFEGIEESSDPDGRHFRADWKLYGGYEDCPDTLPTDVKKLRQVYIDAIEEECNNPEYRLKYKEEE